MPCLARVAICGEGGAGGVFTVDGGDGGVWIGVAVVGDGGWEGGVFGVGDVEGGVEGE